MQILKIEESRITKLKTGNFDLSMVNQMLENKHLSKNAESFKNVFQMYQSTNNGSGSGNPSESKPPFDMSMLSSGLFGGLPFDLSQFPSNQQSNNSFHINQKAPTMENFLASSLLKNKLDVNKQKAPTIEDLKADLTDFQLLSKSKLKNSLTEERITNSSSTELDANFKEYIDKKFEKLNCDIFTRINSFEEETNRKLDLILQKLDNR